MAYVFLVPLNMSIKKDIYVNNEIILNLGIVETGEKKIRHT